MTLARCFACTVVLVIAPAAAGQETPPPDAGEIITAETRDLAGGQLTVCWKPGGEDSALLIHFHGAVDTVRAAYAASNYRGILAIVNFRGLSSAYATPFAADATLFGQVLRQAWAASRIDADAPPEPAWQSIALSSFSAGYGAVREILKFERNFDRIDALIAADSIYAGIVEDAPTRTVNPEQMAPFLRFARAAMRGDKRFVISHSGQPTSYASTTETADYLLQEMMIERRTFAPEWREGWRQTTQAARGRFSVFGFEGVTGPDHLGHLRSIDLLWNRCFADDVGSSPPLRPAD